MLPFYLVVTLMLLLALVLVLPVFWRKDGSSSATLHDQTHANVLIAREALAQLQASNAAGNLGNQDFESQQLELEHNLAIALKMTPAASAETTAPVAWVAGLTIALVIPIAAVLMYAVSGTPQSMDPAFVTAMNQPRATAEQLPPVDELLPQLEAHLDANPEDLKGWRLLGVTYLRLRRFADAERALSEARRLAPNNPDVLLELVDARAMARAGKIDSESERLLLRALSLSPADVRGLWMLGMLRQQQGRVDDAVVTWRSLQEQLVGQPELLADVQQLIDNATGGPAVQTPSQPAPGIVVRVDLDSAVASQVEPDMAVFVYAKAMAGPPMPLAVSRHRVADLPLTITLDDTMAMMPQMKLSSYAQVVVGARISRSGDPLPKPGDFQVERSGIAVVDKATIELLIAQPLGN